ncbi:MAG: hypothetical protein HQK83_09910 [Fibrobacteria bacterium]|nr:hypothetical protein [Fibrobacteria bacterium]
MKRFLLHILLYSITLFSIIISINEYCYKNAFLYWGETATYQNKLRYLLHPDKNTNTAIIGSSRIHHHVNPKIVDSLCAEQDVFIRTINLGSGHQFPPKTIYLAQTIINQAEETKLKYLIIELNPFSITPAYLRKVPRFYYWVNIQQLFYWSTKVIALKESVKFKFRSILNLIYLYGNQLSNIKLYQNVIANSTPDITEPEHFISTDSLLRKNIQEGRWTTNHNPHAIYLKNLDNINFIPVIVGENDSTRVIQNLWQNLITTAHKKNIQIFFMSRPAYTPRIAEKYFNPDQLLNLNLDSFYFQAPYRFEEHHLNEAGATIFSQKLGETFCQKISRKSTP